MRPLLLLPDPGRDVSEELDDLLLTVGRGLQDVQDGLGGALVLGQQALQTNIQRFILPLPLPLSLLEQKWRGPCY